MCWNKADLVFDCWVVRLKAYPPDRRLCVYTVLKEYLVRTQDIRGKYENKLMFSHIRPYKAVMISIQQRMSCNIGNISHNKNFFATVYDKPTATNDLQQGHKKTHDKRLPCCRIRLANNNVCLAAGTYQLAIKDFCSAVQDYQTTMYGFKQWNFSKRLKSTLL